MTEHLHALEEDPEAVRNEFTRLHMQSGTASRKGMLALDHLAEAACRTRFQDFSEDLQFVGEESLSGFSAWGPKRYCVLVDMVDGTDLLEMGINLWCSAIIIYDQYEDQIIASVVGTPSGQVFYAHEGSNRAFVRGEHEYELFGCSDVKTLANARICFYGQKFERLIGAIGSDAFQRGWSRLEGAAKDTARIYNFAGNPMMVKLANRPKGDDNNILTGDVDAVFEIAGQQVHDMAPGAFIAMKAGAYMCDLQGVEITMSGLSSLLKNPKQRVSYVIASTKELAEEIVQLFGNGSIEEPVSPSGAAAQHRASSV